MKFQELPPEIRVKLYKDQEQRLWNKVEKKGIPQAAAEAGYSCSSIYNWRSKDSFLPVEFVSTFVDVERVKALKGGGRSLPMKEVELPLEFSDELLTRIDVSVHVNEEGVPVYQTTERELLKRFAELLEELGAPYQVYSRSVYELRFPKYLYSIIKLIDFSTDFAALVDEKGSVEAEKVVAGERKVPVEEFYGELYSRDKKLELALQREDEEKIREIMAEEAGKVREALQP